jgi:hypothetical protein
MTLYSLDTESTVKNPTKKKTISHFSHYTKLGVNYNEHVLYYHWTVQRLHLFNTTSTDECNVLCTFTGSRNSNNSYTLILKGSILWKGVTYIQANMVYGMRLKKSVTVVNLLHKNITLELSIVWGIFNIHSILQVGSTPVFRWHYILTHFYYIPMWKLMTMIGVKSKNTRLVC